MRLATWTRNGGPTGSIAGAVCLTASYSGIMIAVGIPDAAWKRAKLATASPNPPLLANGASSAARWITRTVRPSGSTSGGFAGAAESSWGFATERGAVVLSVSGSAALDCSADSVAITGSRDVMTEIYRTSSALSSQC
jgi:hypothetical protein